MFFALSKILGFFAMPSNLLVMLGLVGLALTATRLARIGRRLAAAALILFAVVGVSPFSKALIKPLEDRFPPWDASRGPPVGIVVLGGAIDPDLAAERGRSLNEGAPSASPSFRNSPSAIRWRASSTAAATQGWGRAAAARRNMRAP